MTTPDFAAALDGAAEAFRRFGQAVAPAPQNRRQRRAQGKPRRSGREAQLQAILRLSGKGRTRRPAKRR